MPLNALEIKFKVVCWVVFQIKTRWVNKKFSPAVILTFDVWITLSVSKSLTLLAKWLLDQTKLTRNALRLLAFLTTRFCSALRATLPPTSSLHLNVLQLRFWCRPTGCLLSFTTANSRSSRTPATLLHWKKFFAIWFTTQIRLVKQFRSFESYRRHKLNCLR